jgi:hypothetical protein
LWCTVFSGSPRSQRSALLRFHCSTLVCGGGEGGGGGVWGGAGGEIGVGLGRGGKGGG